jgi:folate-binding Fe-S cluster repair protein YgfZ
LTQPPSPPREEEAQEGHDEPTTAASPSVEFSDKLRAVCFLDNKGRIVTDSLLWKVDDTHYYIDVPGETADSLLGHLKPFILRRTKVKVEDVSTTIGAASHVIFGTLNAHGTPDGYLSAVDPRHPSLGLRILSLSEPATQQLGPLMKTVFPAAPGTYQVIRKLAGVAEGSELHSRIAGETNQEFLNAVSFSKGTKPTVLVLDN